VLADELPPTLDARLRYLLRHIQPRWPAKPDGVAAAPEGTSGSSKKAPDRPAGHLFLGSIASNAANAQRIVPERPQPLDNAAWAANSTDRAAELYCHQCMAHIQQEYIVRSYINADKFDEPCVHVKSGSKQQFCFVCFFLVSTVSVQQDLHSTVNGIARTCLCRFTALLTTLATRVQEAAARSVIAHIQRAGAASVDEPEVLASAAFNAESPIANALAKANSLLRPSRNAAAFVICPRSVLPAQGLEHHLVYLHCGSDAKISSAADKDSNGKSKTQGKGSGSSDKELGMCIVHVARAVPVDARMAAALADKALSRALRGSRVDCTYTVLCLNHELPVSWLAGLAGGSKGSGKEVCTCTLFLAAAHKTLMHMKCCCCSSLFCASLRM
jgi:hypothetical protein